MQKENRRDKLDRLTATLITTDIDPTAHRPRVCRAENSHEWQDNQTENWIFFQNHKPFFFIFKQFLQQLKGQTEQSQRSQRDSEQHTTDS